MSESITLTKEELTQIYTRWIADHRGHPEEFYSDEYRKTAPLEGYVEDSVRYFLDLLKEIQG